MSKIDFGYTFSTPHMITLSRPSASEKMIVGAKKEGLSFSYSYSSLKTAYPLSCNDILMDVQLFMDFYVDNEVSPLYDWERHESGAPCLIARSETDNVSIIISAIATKSGVVIKTEFHNTAAISKEVKVQLAHTNGWVISNLGWYDGINNNLLISANSGEPFEAEILLDNLGYVKPAV